MDLNLIVLAGQLAAPPELRSFESGSSVLRLLVTIRTSTPRRRVDVVPITLWDPPQEITEVLPESGERVWVAGSVQRRFWESSDGRRSRLEIVAHQVQRDVECGGVADGDDASNRTGGRLPSRAVTANQVTSGPSR